MWILGLEGLNRFSEEEKKPTVLQSRLEFNKTMITFMKTLTLSLTRILLPW